MSEGKTYPAPDALPCPFCGHETVELEVDEDREGEAYAYVRCPECSGNGPMANQDDDEDKAPVCEACKQPVYTEDYYQHRAIEAWNKRAEPAPPSAIEPPPAPIVIDESDVPF